MDLQTKIQSQTSAGDLGPVVGVGGFRVGKLGKFAHSCNKGKLIKVRAMLIKVRAMLMIMMCILVIRCAAPPIIIMGAWSMAVLLGQHIDLCRYDTLQLVASFPGLLPPPRRAHCA